MFNYFSNKAKKNCLALVDRPQRVIKNKQQGFTLVTVLILSSLASILVLNSLKDNVNQERLSGNFQKKINARLVSERGVFDTMKAISTFLTANPTATIAELAAKFDNTSGSASLGYGTIDYKIELTETTSGELLLSSTGNHFEGAAELNVRLKIVPGSSSVSSSNSPFTDAVLGCDAVDLSGSGQIDSYNSNDAPYDSANPGVDGDVTTINNDGADVTLGGNSPIMGDINATGKIDLSSSNVTGNLHANDDITIDNGSGLRVSGNVLTRGNYYQKSSGNIGGHVRVNGDASMTWSNSILNTENNGLDILYGGSGTFDDTTNNAHYLESQYNQSPDVTEVPDDDDSADDYDKTDAATNCDHLDIESVVNAVDDGTGDLRDYSSRNWGDADISYMTPDDEMTHYWQGVPYIWGSTLFEPVNTTVLGETTALIKFKSFHLKNNLIIKGGDVTLFVEGDFIMSGSAQLTIEAGSSLTLIMKGAVVVGNGADIIAEQHGFTDSGLPAMSIYSSYNGSGITLSGDFEMYAAIYAPLTDVTIKQGASLYGAVRGKSVTVDDGAAIHYDAALGSSNRGGSASSSSSSSSSSTLAFVSWEY